jgi:hypothetical protein
VIIPESIKWIENNVFAGCKKLKLENQSSFFKIHEGVLYNNEMTQLYFLYDHNIENLILPDKLKTIGKNSFFGSDNLKHLTIPNSITRIGYNPFVGCISLDLTNHSPEYLFQNGMLFDSIKSKLIFCSNPHIKDTIDIPNEIDTIGRNAFSLCLNLKQLTIPNNISLIERGAFSGCRNLKEITIPKTVKYVGKWCFSYCTSLEQIDLPKGILMEEYVFSGCPAKINYY